MLNTCLIQDTDAGGWEHFRDASDIVEERIRLDELRHAARIWVVNSVRKWREAELID